MVGIVVIGAGQAGATTVEKLRAGGYEGELTLIGDEPHPPYQRPPLSKKYLLGEMEVERLYLRPSTFYADNNISLLTGETVTKIDRAARAIELASGRSIPYQTLVLTTGSRPRLLPAAMGGKLPGVFPIRTLNDIDALGPAVQPGARVLVIGGGYIGLEAAAVAASKGLKVTLVETAERILQRVASPETSSYFRALHQSHGVEIREGVGLKTLVGETRVTGAELCDGTTMAIDCAIVGVGITPETSLAEAAGLAIDNGIQTDAYGCSSDPGIYAAGDCASFPYRDTRIRLESVPHAIDQASTVAAAILEGTTPYEASPWFWSDQYDVKLQTAGLNTGYDRVVTRPGAKPGAQSVWHFKGSELLAVDAMNDPRAYMTGKRWIEAGLSPCADSLVDPETDLKTLV